MLASLARLGDLGAGGAGEGMPPRGDAARESEDDAAAGAREGERDDGRRRGIGRNIV